MSKIKSYIQSINNKNEKVLSIFLTSGYPNKNNFVENAIEILENGADIIELGIPFSDPLADGPTIQASSQHSLENGITLKDSFEFAERIKAKTDKPIIAMGYANPIITYGYEKFIKESYNSGIDGLIVPDVPLEEHDYFFDPLKDELDIILLTTPTSSEDKIKKIDFRSSGFVYCVSVTGTTGVRNTFSNDVFDKLEKTYNLIQSNKMLIGFGISNPDDVKKLSNYCDGVIVGSAVIKSLSSNRFEETIKLIQSLKQACK